MGVQIPPSAPLITRLVFSGFSYCLGCIHCGLANLAATRSPSGQLTCSGSDNSCDMRFQLPLGAVLTLLVVLAAVARVASHPLLNNDDEDGLGAPSLYGELRDTEPQPAGYIRDGVVIIDRFTFELEAGHLYLTPPVAGGPSIAVYLGRGRVRAIPPDGVELQQLRKLIDEDYLDERFNRFVFWTTGDLSGRLRALADDTLGQETVKAAELVAERRKALLEDQLANPDSRILADLWRETVASALADPIRPYFYAEIDGRAHDWFSIEIEPREREEVRVVRFERRHNMANVWTSFHALDNFPGVEAATRFPREPMVDGPVDTASDSEANEWSARDYGLSTRVLTPEPEHERWSPRVAVSRVDVDIAIESNGEAMATAAFVVEPLMPLASVRLRVSPFADVTDVRWRPRVPTNVNNLEDVTLLSTTPGENAAADKPRPLTGEAVHFVQEKHERRMRDDLNEPWLTILLPRLVERGQRFVLEVAYKGEPVERLRGGRGYVLKDPANWIPRHPDNRKRRLDLTFRVPERFRVASGGALQTEHVDDGTRVTRWTIPTPVRGTMAFHLGRFDVEKVQHDGLPDMAIYADRNHPGFSPGSRERTVENLVGSLRTYVNYFGPYPFESLLVTETSETGGQAFAGLVLLTFQAFGPLHTGEAELFWSHEVAHQWWGASVDWEDYRDQWISEGFAHYASALYALVGLDDEDQFQRMLDAWRLDVLGEVNVGQGIGLKRYGARPSVIQKSDGNESGPLVVGYRLRTVDTPFDYRLLVYEKGAYILHMLRMLLLDLETGSDERFRDLMRGFAAAHRGDVASTRSFEEAVTAAFGESMDWFFDQWVYGVDVPTYRPDLKVSPVRDSTTPFVLHGHIRQENVPRGFQMAVPIRIKYDGRAPTLRRVWVDQPEVSVEIPLPAEPTDIEFNYNHGVLAHVR